MHSLPVGSQREDRKAKELVSALLAPPQAARDATLSLQAETTLALRGKSVYF